LFVSKLVNSDLFEGFFGPFIDLETVVNFKELSGVLAYRVIRRIWII
jgi:hypothetical protein